MYPNNPMLNQQMAQLDQEYAQRKANIMQNFYDQQQSGNWGRQSAQGTQQSQTPSQNVNWIYVSGVDGAKNQIVQPGQTAWMMDNNEPYFYVKSVDNVGSSTFRIFQFAEVQEIQPEQEAQPQIDLSQYVQRDEFDDLKAQLEQLTNTQKKQPTKANKGVEDNG
ncbi:MAG: hypothetical protein HFH88_11140 [Lachnospiraceae bacterium]|nr:hypothetical protein [Lachnospiraceae bacterium]